VSDRIELERDYWDEAALDPEVDTKYISDVSTEECLRAINFNAVNGPSLEIGCGVGRIVRAWLDGYGIDISRNMIVNAQLRDPKNHYKVCDGRTIPYEDEKFYQVACTLVFQHLKADTIKGYMAETYRVLKPGGLFRFQFIEGTEQEPFSNHYELEEMKLWIEQAGLKFIKADKGLCHPQWTWVTCVR